jgi:hypothetical protein
MSEKESRWRERVLLLAQLSQERRKEIPKERNQISINSPSSSRSSRSTARFFQQKSGAAFRILLLRFIGISALNSHLRC